MPTSGGKESTDTDKDKRLLVFFVSSALLVASPSPSFSTLGFKRSGEVTQGVRRGGEWGVRVVVSVGIIAK